MSIKKTTTGHHQQNITTTKILLVKNKNIEKLEHCLKYASTKSQWSLKNKPIESPKSLFKSTGYLSRAFLTVPRPHTNIHFFNSH